MNENHLAGHSLPHYSFPQGYDQLDGGRQPPSQWLPGTWQDSTRKSAFLPYRPTVVLTNLQRGNVPTESPTEETERSFYQLAGQGELTEEDLEPGIDVDIVDANGLSALMWASSYGQVRTAQLLIQRGALVNRQGSEGETSLLLAAAYGHFELVRLLTSEGATVDQCDMSGNTALMYAAYGNHPYCAKELLKHGADISAENYFAETAYGIVVANESHLTREVLESHLIMLLM